MKKPGRISIEVVRDGDIEQCRDLCDELMEFQKSQAVMSSDVFDGMNFDTRMKTSYENALASHVAVVKDDGRPVGYVFSTIEKVEKDQGPLPAWAPVKEGEKALGFYPRWDDLPERAGCLSNLYFRDEYRGMGLGGKLMDISMEWFAGFPDIDLVFIYISNGNAAALDFYKKHGFKYSHDVFGGFITAVYKFIK